MTDLSRYSNVNFLSTQNKWKSILWYVVSHLIFTHHFLPFYGIKKWLLTTFGAKIGKGFVIKPGVKIKYPWNLTIGDYTWLGENVWIDNLGMVSIGNNVCVSQGAFLLTGNHNYKSCTFDLKVDSIVLEDGVWIGAKAVLSPGVTCKSYSVLALGSVLTTNMEAYAIYQGNPASKKRIRQINS